MVGCIQESFKMNQCLRVISTKPQHFEVGHEGVQTQCHDSEWRRDFQDLADVAPHDCKMAPMAVSAQVVIPL